MGNWLALLALGLFGQGVFETIVNLWNALSLGSTAAVSIEECLVVTNVLLPVVANVHLIISPIDTDKNYFHTSVLATF